MKKKINIILNPVGDNCNLNCIYCYKDKIVNNKTMSLDIIYKIFLVIAQDKNIQEVNFTWHGGEPLLYAIENYKKIVNYQKIILKDKKYKNIIQTNGLLLKKDFILFFKKENFFIGISLDGPTYADNKLRFSTEELFQQVIANLKLLKEKNIQISLQIVIHKKNLTNIDRIHSFIQEFNPISFTLIPIDSLDNSLNLSIKELKYLLIKSFKFSKITNITNSYIQDIENTLIKKKPPRLCFFSGKCNSFISVSVDGTVYMTCNVKNNIVCLSLKDALRLSKKNTILKNDSIYMLSDKNLKLKYFQGNGCLMRKDNLNFCKGIIAYLNWRVHDKQANLLL